MTEAVISPETKPKPLRAADAPKKLTIISARPRTTRGQIAESWRHRGYYPLLFREIANKKFRATLFGVWWLVLRPLMSVGIATFVFSFVIQMESEGLPYAVFYLSGFCLWSFFATQVSFAPRTILWMRSLMRKVYFPRLLIPAASFGPALADLGVTLVLLALAVVGFSLRDGTSYFQLSWGLLAFPLYLGIAGAFALAFSMVLSMTAIVVRDVVFMTTYIVQMAMFITPVLYPASEIPKNIRWAVFTFNPMATVVEGSRWSLFGVGEFRPGFTLVAVVVSLLMLTLATVFFCRAERVLEDAL